MSAARKALANIKKIALGMPLEDVPAQLAKIVRLCIDAGAASPAQRNWTEDSLHENGNYECICGDCGQTFIGRKRRVVCKSCALIPDVAQSVWMPIETAPKGPMISVARKGGQRDDGSTYWYQAIGHYDPNLGHFHKSYGELYGEPEVWARYPENPEHCAALPAEKNGLVECPTCVRRFKPGEHCDLSTCSLNRSSADSALAGMSDRLGDIIPIDEMVDRLERRGAELNASAVTPNGQLMLKAAFYIKRLASYVEAVTTNEPQEVPVSGASETWAYIERLLVEECGLREDEGLWGQRANCVNAIKNGLPDEALMKAAVEFLGSGEGLHKIRVNGKMMTRKDVSLALSRPHGGLE